MRKGLKLYRFIIFIALDYIFIITNFYLYFKKMIYDYNIPLTRQSLNTNIFISTIIKIITPQNIKNTISTGIFGLFIQPIFLNRLFNAKLKMIVPIAN